MKSKILFLAVIFTIILISAGCSSKENQNTKSKETLTIYTTIFPIEDFTAKIGGEHVNVESILPPGADAHTFEPSAKTMTKIADADALIYTGVGLEGFVDAVKETLKDEHVTLIPAGEKIDLEETHDHDHDDEKQNESHTHNDVDPHVWIDPIHSITLAKEIKDSLVKLKPEQSDDFEKNYQMLKQQLEVLDEEFRNLVRATATNEILVSHAAYGYWEKRYGIHQISVSGLSPTQEPSQKQLQEVIETAKEHKVKYVIFEQNLTSSIAEMVQTELGAEALTLHNLEALTDKDIKNKEDYFSLMNKNVETLKKAMN